MMEARLSRARLEREEEAVVSNSPLPKHRNDIP